MANQTTVLQCPVCAQRLRVPCDLGEIQVTCPACRARWPWKANSSRRAIVVFNVVAGVVLIGAVVTAFLYFRKHRADETASSNTTSQTSPASTGDSAGAPERSTDKLADNIPKGSVAERLPSADSLTTDQNLARTVHVYGNCKTYQDEGKLTLRIGGSDIVFQFSTVYAKPDRFRYERKHTETTHGGSNIPLPSAGGGPVSSGGDLEDTPVWVEIEFKNAAIDEEIPKKVLDFNPPK
jgi:hypothetical protein